MASILDQANRQPDNGSRNFVASILSRLPYVSNVFDADESNPRYELFHRLAKNRETKVMQQSVITGPFMANNDYYSPNSFLSDQGYHNFIYAQLDQDKTRRIAEYRRMAAYAEVADCLDEICDEFIVKDDQNKIIKIDFTAFSRLESEEKTELEKEFYKFINIYELEQKGWGYCRQLLTEGELFFENVVHEQHQDKGVIGSLSIPGELINPVYDNIQNNVIQNFLFQKPISMLNNPAGANAMPALQNNSASALQNQILTLQGNQVTYINSGIWNEDKSVRIPFIENCRRAYKQLSLLEDAVIIYSLVRAPERLKFKIDTGNMPPDKAMAYLRQVQQNYWNRKTYDSTKDGAQNIYDPQSMLDSYFFTKNANGAGSDVELMPGGGQISALSEPLQYYVLKLYKSLKVPTSRLNAETQFKDGSEILREELHFAKFIIRLQNQFAAGFKNAFIAHLKLRGWWKEYKLHESYFSLRFNEPSSYFAIRNQQLYELKLKNFNDMSSNESISNLYAQKTELEWSDSQISANMEWQRKEAALKWELAQIETSGPNWREQLEATEKAATSGEGGMPSGGGEGGMSSGGEGAVSGGGSAIPAFGGGEIPAGAEGEPPQPTEGGADEETPEEDEEEETTNQTPT